MYFVCCIYVLLLLNMPEMAHNWINKSMLLYSILFYSLTDVSSGARGLDLGQSLNVHPYIVHTSSEGSGESVQLHRLP